MKNMPKLAGHSPISIMGTTVLGERGQVVIPKSVRDNLGLAPGARLIVLQHERDGIALVPAERMRSMLEEMNQRIGQALTTLND